MGQIDLCKVYADVNLPDTQIKIHMSSGFMDQKEKKKKNC